MHNFHDYSEFETMTTPLRVIQKKLVNSSHREDFLSMAIRTVYNTGVPLTMKFCGITQ